MVRQIITIRKSEKIQSRGPTREFWENCLNRANPAVLLNQENAVNPAGPPTTGSITKVRKG